MIQNGPILTFLPIIADAEIIDEGWIILHISHCTHKFSGTNGGAINRR
jgi:hypothetical protein